MKEKLERIGKIAHRIESEMRNNAVKKSAALEGLHSIQSSITELINEIDDSVVYCDEDNVAPVTPRYPDEIDGKYTKYGLAKALNITVKTVENRMRDHRRGLCKFPVPTSCVSGNGGRSAFLWSIESIEKYKRKHMPKPKKQKQSIGIVYEVDGLLTKNGVARKMNTSPDAVDSLLERTRRIGGIFPMPCEKKNIGTGIPANVWRPEDINAYIECRMFEP